jgi:UDP-xylose:glucoside alpha-1,3-xylosyltransferase
MFFSLFLLKSLLQEVDSVLYMDTDTIFLTSPLQVWEHFNKMNEMQMAAVAPEHEDFSTGWYNRFARHPYYGNLGLLFERLSIKFY